MSVRFRVETNDYLRYLDDVNPNLSTAVRNVLGLEHSDAPEDTQTAEMPTELREFVELCSYAESVISFQGAQGEKVLAYASGSLIGLVEPDGEGCLLTVGDAAPLITTVLERMANGALPPDSPVRAEISLSSEDAWRAQAIFDEEDAAGLADFCAPLGIEHARLSQTMRGLSSGDAVGVLGVSIPQQTFWMARLVLGDEHCWGLKFVGDQANAKSVFAELPSSALAEFALHA